MTTPKITGHINPDAMRGMRIEAESRREGTLAEFFGVSIKPKSVPKDADTILKILADLRKLVERRARLRR